MADSKEGITEAETLTIRVKDQTGEETLFKVKPHTKMSKIFDAYASRKGVASNAIRFLLDGARIQPDQTPKMLELEDEDQIDVALEQVGGENNVDGSEPLELCVVDENGEETVKQETTQVLDGDSIDFKLEQQDGHSSADDIQTLTLRVKDKKEDDSVFNVKPLTYLSDIFDAYCSRKGLDPKAIRFLFDGVRVTGNQTPKELEMEDGDELTIVLEQQGGGAGGEPQDHPESTVNAENKPPSNANGESSVILTIRVKDQTGEETFFKVKPHTKMGKIFKAYAERRGVSTEAMRFLLDGARIRPDQTPKMLELEDQDQIDAALEQVGGADDVKPDDVLTIRVKDQTGEETFFKVKPHTKMEKIFKAYADRKGVGLTAVRFLLDGARIQPDQTPKMLELEDQDQIDVALEQVGGWCRK